MVVEVETDNIKTQNGTLIPKDVLIKAIKEYAEEIKDNCVFGFVHGADNVDENGCYKMNRVSHLVNSMEVSDDGVKADISFPNTIWGNITKGIYDVEGARFVPDVVLEGDEVKEIGSINLCLNKIGYNERRKK